MRNLIVLGFPTEAGVGHGLARAVFCLCEFRGRFVNRPYKVAIYRWVCAESDRARAGVETRPYGCVSLLFFAVL